MSDVRNSTNDEMLVVYNKFKTIKPQVSWYDERPTLVFENAIEQLNDEQLKIFKDLKESYLTPYYMPYDKNSIENNLKKISLVIETIEEKRK